MISRGGAPGTLPTLKASERSPAMPNSIDPCKCPAGRFNNGLSTWTDITVPAVRPVSGWPGLVLLEGTLATERDNGDRDGLAVEDRDRPAETRRAAGQ